MPVLSRRNLEQPLCYDPGRKQFIFYRDIISGKEKIIPIESLEEGDLKMLVLERLKRGPDFTIQSLSGLPHGREEVMDAIRSGDKSGKMAVEAERLMLIDLLYSLEKNL